MDVLDLRATLSLDSSQYERGLTGAEAKAKGFGGKLASGLGKAAKVGAVAVAAVGTAAVGAGVAVVKATGQVAEYGDNIDKMSQKMGLSAKAYQEWDAVMRHSGTSIEAMKPSMKTLANAAETGSDAFQKIGLSQEQVASMSQEELFGATIKGLQNVSDTTERTYLAGKLLGRGATELGALLNTSAEDTQKMKDRVNELGGVMSDEAVKASAQYQDSLQDLQTAMQGIKRNAISKFLPGMVDVMEGLTSVFAGEKGGQGRIKKGIDSMIKAVGKSAPSLAKKLGQILKALASAFMDNLPAITSNIVKFFVSAVKGIVNAIPQAGSAGVGMLSSIAKTMMQAIPSLVKSIASVVETGLPTLVESWLKMIRDFAQNIAENGGDLTSAGSGVIGSIIKGIVDTIPVIIQYVPQIMLAIVQAIIRMLPSILKAGVKITLALIKGILSIVPSIGKGLVKGAKSAINKVKNLNWKNLGINIVKGIARGILGAGGIIVKAAVNAAKRAFNAAKKFLGISSPSRLFRDVIGKNIASGMALGINDNEPMIIKAMDDIDRQLITPYNEPQIGMKDSQQYEDESFVDVTTSPIETIATQQQPRDLTVILELDRTILAKTVYRMNNEETQRVGVKLTGALA